MGQKVIISNKAALIAHFGAVGHANIENAIFRLMAAESELGIETDLYYLDKLQNGHAVAVPTDRQQNKDAIEWILRNPTDSILIVGGHKVVPFEDHYYPQQPVENPCDANSILTVTQAASRLLDTSSRPSYRDIVIQLDYAVVNCQTKKPLSTVKLGLR